MRNCPNCGKFMEEWVNYCSWSCHVDQCKKEGFKEHLPNNLPVGCVTATGLMLEHEHGDHPDYKFPVTIEYCGPEENKPCWTFDGDKTTPAPELQEETHALIYCDGSVAITMYECCYAMWYLHRNEFGGGSLWNKGAWRLTEESLKEIRERYPEHHD